MRQTVRSLAESADREVLLFCYRPKMYNKDLLTSLGNFLALLLTAYSTRIVITFLMILCYLYFQKIEGYFFTFSPPTSFSKKNNYITIKILQIVSNNVRSSSQGGRSHILYCVQ